MMSCAETYLGFAHKHQIRQPDLRLERLFDVIRT